MSTLYIETSFIAGTHAAKHICLHCNICQFIVYPKTTRETSACTYLGHPYI